MIVVAGIGTEALYSAHTLDQEEVDLSQVPSYDQDDNYLAYVHYYHIPRGFSGTGSGTESDPYIITNVDQFQEMNDDLTAWYALGNDINLLPQNLVGAHLTRFR
jgi:hypothetical protein